MKDSFRKILFTIGFPFSPVYSQVMKVRTFLYQKGILKSYRLPVPVISVGNLTMGGSGKTPVVIYLAEMLVARGFKPAVVSRGYKGKARADVTVVSDSNTILVDSAVAGDEPVLISRRVDKAVVATGKKRYIPCRKVIDAYGCDVIILDDGFQHLPVKRDIDLVLFDTVFFAGNSRVFPGGDLREPVSSLNRCTAFLITGVNQLNYKRAEKCAELLHSKFPLQPIFKTGSRYKNVHEVLPENSRGPTSTIPVASLPEKLIVFSGIANPLRFKLSLELESIPFLEFIPFPDHHNYSADDIKMLSEKAKTHGAAGFLTTEKDFVRITDPCCFQNPLYYLPQYLSADSAFDGYILDLLQKTINLSNDREG